MSAMASQITSFSIACSAVCSGADQRKQQSSVLLALCAGNSPMTGVLPAQRASIPVMHIMDADIPPAQEPRSSIACLILRQAIIWTNAFLLSIGTLGRKFNEIWILLSFKKCNWHVGYGLFGVQYSNTIFCIIQFPIPKLNKFNLPSSL